MVIDMTQIATAVTSLKTASDIVSGLIQLRLSSEVQSKVIELQGVILATQHSALAANSEQFSLLEKIRSLEAQITQMKAWDAEKDKYEFKAIGAGAFTYVWKADASPPKPPHWICAHCYENGSKSILQEIEKVRHGDGKVFKCTRCKEEIHVHWKLSPSNPAHDAR